MPPKAPHTTRNILKASNLDVRGAFRGPEGGSRPLKFNFKVKSSSKNQSEKKESKTPRKHHINEKGGSSSNQKEKESNARKKMVNIRQLEQLRSLAYGSSKRQEPL